MKLVFFFTAIKKEYSCDISEQDTLFEITKTLIRVNKSDLENIIIQSYEFNGKKIDGLKTPANILANDGDKITVISDISKGKKRRVVIALGGNALGKNLEEQRRDVKVSAKAIADLLQENCELVVVHGNGPQVGLINNCFNEYYNNHKKDGGFPVPLAMAGAMSEAYIGYDLQNAIQEELKNRKIIVNGIATVITQTEVSKDDPAFKKPTKPIGLFMTKEEAEEKAKELKWEIVEDSGRGYRRVVASPIPKHIVEIDAINAMFKAGSIVICAGGGGIPVFKEGNGYVGAPAVIDKDNAASLLARQLDADLLIILTAVEKVSINFNKPGQKDLEKMTVSQAKKYAEEGQFAPGSMLPKIRAATLFAESKPGRKAYIGHLYKARETIQGLSGTIISL